MTMILSHVGLLPGIMWPSKSQVTAAVEDEKTYFSTVQEMRQQDKDKEAESIRAHKERCKLSFLLDLFNTSFCACTDLIQNEVNAD